MRNPARHLFILCLTLMVGACSTGKTSVGVVSLSTTTSTGAASRSDRIAVNAISIEAPKAGASFPVAMYRLDRPGRDKQLSLRRDFKAGEDIAPALRNALDTAFVVDPSSPYSAQVSMIPSYSIYFDNMLDFTHEVNGTSAIYVSLLEGERVLFKEKRYSGHSKDEHSVLDTTFPPNEMMADLLGKSMVEAVAFIAADRGLDEFRP